MRVAFDPVKEAENQRKHGLSLRAAVLLFAGPFIEEEDARHSYRETRFVATGPIALFGGRIFVVVYT